MWAVLVLTAFLFPDPVLTPGVVRQLTAEQVCSIRWGKDIRHITEKMKRHVCGAYKVKDCPGSKFEIDHLISRELAGADDILNLWPQPIAEARIKDKIENFLHRQICSNKLSLRVVQKRIAKDWTQFIQTISEAK